MQSSSRQFSEVDQELYTYIRQNLNTARKRAKYEDEKKRVEMLEAFFSYSEMLFNMYNLKNEVFEKSEKKNWRHLLSNITKLKKKNEKIKEQFKNNPEWFAGAGAKQDYFINDDLERYGSWTIMTELDTAERNCIINIAEKPRLHLRKSHPWYRHEFLYHNISAEKINDNTFSFKSVEPQLKPEERQKPYDKFKGQYLAAFSTRIPFGIHGRHYKHLAKFKGKNGKLTVTIGFGAANSGRPIITQIKEIGGEEKEHVWDLVVRPSMFDKKTRKILPMPETPVKGMIDIYLMWTPSDKD
ncbi:MAG: hypothetical protein ACYTFY_21080, partial [Planctomycetota bacterium]